MKPLQQTHILSPEEITLLRQCKNAVQSVVPNAQLILYGSRARGEAHPESDYDLLVLLDQNVSLTLEDKIRTQIFPIELAFEKVLTINAYSLEDWQGTLYAAMPFHQNVERDGIVL